MGYLRWVGLSETQAFLPRVTLLLAIACLLPGCAVFAELIGLRAGAAAVARGAVIGTEGLAVNLARGGALAATPGEISALRTMGYGTASASAEGFILGRSLTQTHLTTFVQIERRAFSQLPRGQRVYAAIENRGRAEAGWLRKEGGSIYFNDGTRDLLRSDIRGDQILHYSTRSGRPTPLARTHIIDGGRQYRYSIWIPEANSFVETGYGVPSTVAKTIDIFTLDGRLAGTLRYSSLGQIDAARLPRPTIASPIAFGAVTVLAMLATFQNSPNSVALSNCAESNQRNSQSCVAQIQETIAAAGYRLQFTVVPDEGRSSAGSSFFSISPSDSRRKATDALGNQYFSIRPSQ